MSSQRSGPAFAYLEERGSIDALNVHHKISLFALVLDMMVQTEFDQNP